MIYNILKTVGPEAILINHFSLFDTMDVFNKFTGNAIRSFETTDAASIENILNRTRIAFNAFESITDEDKIQALQKMMDSVIHDHEILSTLISEETGKPISLSLEEIQRTEIIINAAIRVLQDGFCGAPNSALIPPLVNYSVQKKFSRGTVAATVDYGNPLFSSALRICASIATGNSLLLFPSLLAPSPSLKLISYLDGTPLSQYTVQPVLNGEKDILDTMVSKAVNIQDSWKLVFSRRQFRHFETLEHFDSMGGSRYSIIWKDADLDGAAESIAASLFNSYGGNYVRSMKVIIHNDVFEYIVNRFSELLLSMKVGDPLGPDTEIGPMISGSIVSKTSEILQTETVSGSFPLMDLNIKDPFIHPVLLDATGSSGKLTDDGVFGPVISVYKVDSLQEIVDMYGFKAEGGNCSLYTSDINIAKSLFERSRFSSLNVNREPFTVPEDFRKIFFSELVSRLYTRESTLNL